MFLRKLFFGQIDENKENCEPECDQEISILITPPLSLSSSCDSLTSYRKNLRSVPINLSVRRNANRYCKICNKNSVGVFSRDKTNLQTERRKSVSKYYNTRPESSLESLDEQNCSSSSTSRTSSRDSLQSGSSNISIRKSHNKRQDEENSTSSSSSGNSRKLQFEPKNSSIRKSENKYCNSCQKKSSTLLENSTSCRKTLVSEPRNSSNRKLANKYCRACVKTSSGVLKKAVVTHHENYTSEDEDLFLAESVILFDDYFSETVSNIDKALADSKSVYEDLEDMQMRIRELCR